MKKISVSFLVFLFALPTMCLAELKEVKIPDSVYELIDPSCHFDSLMDNDFAFKKGGDCEKPKKKQDLKKIKVGQKAKECVDDAKVVKAAKECGIQFILSDDNESPIAPDLEEENKLYKAMISRKVNVKDLCVSGLGSTTSDTEDCANVSNIFGICDVHEFNLGPEVAKGSSEDRDKVREVVAWKTTVFSQQMYKDYEYLSATLKRIRTQLQKAVLSAKLEMAGAETGRSSNASGHNGNDDKTLFLSGAQNCSNLFDMSSAYSCLQNNVSIIVNNVANNYKNACLQLQTTLASARIILQNVFAGCEDINENGGKSCTARDKQHVTKCAQGINYAVMRQKKDDEDKRYNNNRY